MFCRNQRGRQTLPERFFGNQRFGQAELVTLQELGRARLKQCKAGARQHHGHTAQQTIVDHLRLGQISELARTADISGGWHR